MSMVLAIFALLMFFILLGIPVAFSIGLSSLASIFLFDLRVSLTLIPAQMFAGVNSYALMAIPFFILAGEMMNTGGLTKRIIDLAESIVGHVRGGLAHVNIVASMLFAGVSGSGAADTAALGTALIPAMKEKGYDADFSVAITATSATVGPIIPPSVLFIIYGFLTNVSIARLFLGGAIPGVMMGLGLMATTAFVCRRRGYVQASESFSSTRFLKALERGFAALIIPIIIIYSIVTGFATATEAGVIVVFIGLALGIGFRAIRNVGMLRDAVRRALYSTAIIFMILSCSAIFSNILVRAQFQQLVLDGLSAVANTPTQMLLAIAAFILIIGMFVDVTPILIMFAAPLARIAPQLGFDPVFFGVILVISAMIGSVTPPVGGLLLISCSIGKIPITSTIRVLIPFVLTLVAVLVVLISFPEAIMFLPRLIMG